MENDSNNQIQSLYPRSNTAPFFVTSQASTSKLMSFIEVNMTINRKEYDLAISNNEKLFLKIPRKQLLGFFGKNNKNYVRDIKNACDKLMNRRVLVFNGWGGPFEIITLFPYCKLDEHGDLYVEISSAGLKSYQCENNKTLSVYDAQAINRFKKTTTSHFYDLGLRAISMQHWSFSQTIQELKDVFLKFEEDGDKEAKCDDSQIKSRWINAALKELKTEYDKKNIDFYLELDANRHYEKKTNPSQKGRKKISGFVFNVKHRHTNEEFAKETILFKIEDFLKKEIYNQNEIISLMLPLRDSSVTLPMLSTIEQKISHFDYYYKKGSIYNKENYVKSLVNLKKINVPFSEIADNLNVEMLEKWNALCEEFISINPENLVPKIIHNFPVKNWDKENKTFILASLGNDTFTPFELLFNETLYKSLLDCIIKHFDNETKVKIIFKGTEYPLEDLYDYWIHRPQ